MPATIANRARFKVFLRIILFLFTNTQAVFAVRFATGANRPSPRASTRHLSSNGPATRRSAITKPMTPTPPTRLRLIPLPIAQIFGKMGQIHQPSICLVFQSGTPISSGLTIRSLPSINASPPSGQSTTLPQPVTHAERTPPWGSRGKSKLLQYGPLPAKVPNHGFA